MLTLDKVFDAQRVLKGIVRETDCVKAAGLVKGVELYLKPENLQNTGSFKLRGSGYKISKLTEEEKARGVKHVLQVIMLRELLLQRRNMVYPLLSVFLIRLRFQRWKRLRATALM